MNLHHASLAIVAALGDFRLFAAEFMYKPRPAGGREQALFDHCLRARLAALREGDVVLLICDSEVTIASLLPVLAAFPHLRVLSEVVNPQPRVVQTDTPARCQWHAPETWRQMAMSDRWARIDAALRLASGASSPGYLVMPAHDAVYSRRLLYELIALSARFAQAHGVACAVSPFPSKVHSPIPEVEIAADVLDLHNAAFAREPLDSICQHGQGFWGKLGILPLTLCEPVRAAVDRETWEDDLEIDRALGEIGALASCMNVEDSALYQLSPPVFTREDVRRVIERHLHYSLKIPGAKPSVLQAAPSAGSRQRAAHDQRYAQSLADADALIAQCDAAMRARAGRYGASWVDWGGYRYVTRPADPTVEVWKQAGVV